MDKKSIVSAIVVVGVLIAGAILLRGSKMPSSENNPSKKGGIPVTTATLAPVGEEDRTLGNSKAKVTLILYEDFQCPFCGAFNGLNKSVVSEIQKGDSTWLPSESEIINDYVKNDKVQLVYRDFTVVGGFVVPYIMANDESINAAAAARCAGDQNKFWEYHNFLFSHQNGENKGGFSITNLKSFAKDLGLNLNSFNTCVDQNKYVQAVIDSSKEGSTAGVKGTPKGFILKNGEVFSTIDGVESYTIVKTKIDSALK